MYTLTLEIDQLIAVRGMVNNSIFPFCKPLPWFGEAVATLQSARSIIHHREWDDGSYPAISSDRLLQEATKLRKNSHAASVADRMPPATSFFGWHVCTSGSQLGEGAYKGFLKAR
jgi:hypothetical protein